MLNRKVSVGKASLAIGLMCSGSLVPTVAVGVPVNMGAILAYAGSVVAIVLAQLFWGD